MILKVQFAPLEQLKYFEKLHLQTATGVVEVALAGQGVSPSLAIDPPDGKLDLGHIVAGARSVVPVALKNCSVFPLRYSMDPVDEVPHNYDNLEVFTTAPPEATIGADLSQEVKVSFYADHARPLPFRHTIAANVPNQTKRQCLFVTGRCWRRQTYVRPADPADEPKAGHDRRAVEDVFAVSDSLVPSAAAAAAGEDGGEAAGAGARQRIQNNEYDGGFDSPERRRQTRLNQTFGFQPAQIERWRD